MADATNAGRWAIVGPLMLVWALLLLGQGDMAAALIDRAMNGAAELLDHLGPDDDTVHLQLSTPTPSPGAETTPGPQTGPPPTGAGCTTCSIIEDPDGSFAYPHLRSHDG